MKNLLLLAALFIGQSLPSLAQDASGSVSGTVTALFGASGNPNSDARPCLFFQMNNVGVWYAIPYDDPGGPSNVEMVKIAFLGQRNDLGFNFSFGVPSCSNIPLADELHFGLLH